MKSLKDFRIAARLNQQEAAKKIGVSQATICMWENEKTLPQMSKIPVIAQVYSRRIDEITKAIISKEN